MQRNNLGLVVAGPLAFGLIAGTIGMARLRNGSLNWREAGAALSTWGALQGAARTQAKAWTSRLNVASPRSTFLSPWKKTASSIFISLEESQLSVSVVPVSSGSKENVQTTPMEER